jgi:N-acetylmuramoyl-L-alanine amidase
VTIATLGNAAQTDQDFEQKYNQARQSFLDLDKSPQRVIRQYWLPLIERFKEIYMQTPHSVWGEKSMFMVGRIYSLLFQWGGQNADLDLALDHFSRVINNYPQSALADDALYYSAEIYFLHKNNPEKARQILRVLIKDYPKGDMRNKAEELLVKVDQSCAVTESGKDEPSKEERPTEEKKTKPKAEGPSKTLPVVKGMRHWSTPHYTRIVVDIDERVSYRQKILKKEGTKESAERWYLDLYPARLAESHIAPLTIQDGLVKAARIGQFDGSTVRLVLDIESVKSYKVFFLENPFRLIVDVSGPEKGPERPVEPPTKEKKLSLAQQLGLGVKRIIIDAGHGGKDTGAIGKKKLYEKKLTLKLAKKLSKKIQEGLKLETLLTRGVDCFIPLEERTAIANTKQADLFISLHINSSPNPQAEGIETYFLNLATDEESIRVAARENATSTKRISDLQKILKDLMLNAKIDESSRLANHVQQNVVRALNEKYPPVKNLGVKQAPFYVLIGARMPAILVETSFISNDREWDRLNQDDYLDQIVEGLVKGIDSYIKEIKTAGMTK